MSKILYIVNNYIMDLFENLEDDINKKLICINPQLSDEVNCDSIFQADDNFKNHFYFENLTDNGFFSCFGANDEFVDFYKKIIKSGVGVIITGGICVGADNKGEFARISLEDSVINRYKEITKYAHMNYCKIYLKIKSVWGRYSNIPIQNNKFKLASNWGVDPENNKRLTVRASDNKCNDMINDLAQSVILSNIANFDGIMIDASFDNLIGELSSDEFNKRIFGYYSESDDFLKKTLKQIDVKNNTILLKISFLSLFNIELKNANSIRKNQNLIINQAIRRILEYIKLGIDGLEFVFGIQENAYLNEFNQYQDELIFKNFIVDFRKYLIDNNIKNKFSEDVYIFYHDNINNVSSYNNLVENKIINFIDISKNIYSDTAYIKNLLNKKSGLNCIKCSYCNKKSHFNNNIECIINPSLLDNDLKMNLNKFSKSIAIVGAGVSGIVCALTLLERGFTIEIYEKNNELNYNGKLTTIFGFDKLLLSYYKHLEVRLKDFEKRNRLKIFTNQKFSPSSNNLDDYHAIVVATGFSSKFLTIPGAVQSHIVNIYDVLKNENILKNKKNIVLYVKSELSLKLAFYLTVHNYKNITLIIKDFNYFINNKNANIFYYFQNLYKNNANFYYFARIIKINEDNLDLKCCKELKNNNINTFYKIISNAKYNPTYQLINIDCDLLIYEPETKPNNKLYIDLVNKKYAGELYLIGNALENSDLAETIKSAYFVGKNI